MKQITLSIEQMKHLESLGLDTSDASIYWQVLENEISLISYEGNYKDAKYVPTYTLQDILEKLFNIPLKECGIDEYSIYICDLEDNIEHEILTNNNPLEASYQMLLWCIENDYVKTNKV